MALYGAGVCIPRYKISLILLVPSSFGKKIPLILYFSSGSYLPMPGTHFVFYWISEATVNRLAFGRKASLINFGSIFIRLRNDRSEDVIRPVKRMLVNFGTLFDYVAVRVKPDSELAKRRVLAG